MFKAIIGIGFNVITMLIRENIMMFRLWIEREVKRKREKKRVTRVAPLTIRFDVNSIKVRYKTSELRVT